MVHELKYLGTVLKDNLGCFVRYKEEKIKQAGKMANITYSVIYASLSLGHISEDYDCEGLLEEWGILTGATVLCWTRSELKKLQKIENCLWHMILGAPG